MLRKRKSNAFGKDIYLLGKDKDGTTVWLEHPSWDCNWYWGFGYVERYTNKNYPDKAKDVMSHTHIDSEFKRIELIDIARGLDKTVLSDVENVRLSVLFHLFYEMREVAEKSRNYDEDMYKNINGNLIVGVMNNILEVLHPNHAKVCSPF